MRLKGSVTFRLTFWYAVVLTFLLSSFAVFMVMELSRNLHREVDQNLVREIRTIEASITSYLLQDPMPAAVRRWEKETHHLSRSMYMIRIVDHEGRELASNLTGWKKDVIFPDFERDSLFMETNA